MRRAENLDCINDSGDRILNDGELRVGTCSANKKRT